MDTAREAFDDNQEGLGPHHKTIENILEEMHRIGMITAAPANELAENMEYLADVYQEIMDDDLYGYEKAGPAADSELAGIVETLKDGLPEMNDRHTVQIAAQARKLNTPKDDIQGVKGQWSNNVYYLNDDFVPPKHNSQKYTVGEIKGFLKNDYGLSLEGIPYNNDSADFSSIAVANISTMDMLIYASDLSEQEYLDLPSSMRLELFEKTFKGTRKANFKIAETIAAQKQIAIPGLGSDYTATDLRKWREKHFFSWDEQVHTGYNLVPAVIHGNVPHTGLVGVSKKANTMFEKIKKNPQYLPDEPETPISISEFLSKIPKD